MVKEIDVGSDEDDGGLEEFCRINGRIERICRAYGLVVEASGYGGFGLKEIGGLFGRQLRGVERWIEVGKKL